ncbi:GTP cyclohydrolase-2 [compost metagenome]
MFAESLGSTDCDCKVQLDFALEYIAAKGGALIYLAQEGRGIGLAGKIQAIARQQEEGINTAAAYAALGHAKDPRTYASVLPMLESIGFPKKIRLATNNPAKESAVTDMGYIVQERFMPKFDMPERVESYLREKQMHLGHYG